MPVTSAAVIGGGSILSGIIGANSASGDRDAANAARQEALRQFLAINVPDPQQQKLLLDRYKVTGKLTPELENAFQQSQTELGGIVLDPTSRLAEMQALQKMQGVADAGGMDAQAQEKLQTAINSANANEKGQRDAIVSNFAARGQGGSGAELQAQLLAGQSGANRASEQGLQAAADAEQRALAAMSSAATMGSNIRSQDYGQASDAAKAADIINQFNTKNSQQVAGANIDRQNTANQFNLTNQQRVADANTGVSNTEETHNQDLIQQQFNNEMSKAKGATGEFDNAAKQDTANADRTAGQWSGIGQAIGQGAATYGQAANNKDQLDAYKDRTKAEYGE